MMQQRIPAEAIASSTNFGADEETLDLLPEKFVPGKWDVICQRGKECYDHVGNRRFRMIIDGHLGTYMEVLSRRQKTRIVSTIVKNIRVAAEESGGGFVRKDLLTRRWYKVSDKLAREKVGQALRDAIKTKKSAGSQSKAAKRNSKKNLSTQGLTNMIDEQSIQFPISTSQFQGVMTMNAPATPTKALDIPTPCAVPSNGPQYHGENQMVADLEPTPLRGHSMSMPMPMPIPGLFDRSCMAHQRSETSASTLLRLFANEKSSGSDDVLAAKNAVEAAAVHAAASAAASQSRRLSLSQMTFHPIADTSLTSLRNDFTFF
ncbi:unnamed protein product [Cylindrotheca closterium]|uniref:DUF6824 domain-containing protein n=1 Tax=Cylindrotheca closterium TaxID=2856 RepID=A0AAD2G8A6_9STRA|nr:unnamed protein product [Cylindrotheca closterium]